MTTTHDRTAQIWQTLLAAANGRPRWITDASTSKALFAAHPGEVQEVPIPQGHLPLQTTLAAEAHLQTQALIVCAGNLDRIANALERIAQNPPH
jgi:hypothetical protein